MMEKLGVPDSWPSAGSCHHNSISLLWVTTSRRRRFPTVSGLLGRCCVIGNICGGHRRRYAGREGGKESLRLRFCPPAREFFFLYLLRNNKRCFRSCPSLGNAVLRERGDARGDLNRSKKMVSVLKQKSSVGGKPSFCVLLSLRSLLTVSQIFIRGILHHPPPNIEDVL